MQKVFEQSINIVTNVRTKVTYLHKCFHKKDFLQGSVETLLMKTFKVLCSKFIYHLLSESSEFGR